MTTLQGYTDGSYDYRQMYDIKDLKGPLPQPTIRCDTLLGALSENPYCHEFTKIVKAVPEMAALFNDSQSSFTLFVPLSDLPSWKADSYFLRKFILLHTLDRPLPYKFLATSPMMYVNTRLPDVRILVENLNTLKPLLNRSATILGQQVVGNAVIYYISQSLHDQTLFV